MPKPVPVYAGLLLLLCSSLAAADDVPADLDARHFKLTLGNYFYSDPSGDFSGQDLNLRYRRDDTTVWIGYYRDREFGGEPRVGADTSWQPVATIPISILPSVQVATHGFFGGSLALQAGTEWYAQAGIARTNLRPYVDLGFDPGDALQFALGHHADDGSSYSLMTVADDRLHTHQRDTHLLGQWPLPRGQRLTIDLLYKTGDGDSGHVSAFGESITYDFPRWFVREAYDPKQNFGTADATRVSVGMRF
jgi:hypothetical protein